MKRARDEQIAAEARRGVSHSQLAEKYGVSSTRIGQVLQRDRRRRLAAEDPESVQSLGLSTRAINGLNRLGIHRISQLQAVTRHTLESTRNLGASSITQIIDALARRGLHLRSEGGETLRIEDVEASLTRALEDARTLMKATPDMLRAGQLQELIITIESALRRATNLRSPR